MKKIIVVIFLLFLSVLVYYVVPKTETHGIKHKSLPEIPSNEKATKTYGDYVIREYENSECVIDAYTQAKGPCREWEKRYQNGKLEEYISYDITGKLKNRVKWHKNGRIMLIEDSVSKQYFDERGNLEKECTGNEFIGECVEYNETTGRWAISSWIS